MKTVYFEKHPGLYSEDLNYYNFYGLYFKDIFEVSRFFRHIKYDSETTYIGFRKRGINCLRDETTGIIYLYNGTYLPDESFLESYVKRFGVS